MQKMLLLMALLGMLLAADNHESTFSYRLGTRPVMVKVAAYGSSKDVVMISLHDDETTGVEAAGTVLGKTGGVLISIENNHQRNIVFTQRGKSFRFDPNRMFSKTGIKATLTEQGKYSTKSAVNAVHGFAHFLLNKVPRHAAVLIAVHNNGDGGLSVLSYMEGGEFEKDAAEVHKSDDRDPDNFFLTTDGRLYRALRSAGYNVVLQAKKAADDGSLSVYYGRKHKRYINIEAETGHAAEQAEMIEKVIALLRQGA
ncbi:hypothetical protein [Chitinophaga sp.]|uniref:hypothetical protein n=1 Tax=Chitinophaga sp. TaxID=1869181 RepID=UPI0031D57DA1